MPFFEQIRIGGFAKARGINDAGVIAGFTDSGGQQLGFVGSASRGYQLLVPPGGDEPGAVTGCEGINNARQVACVVIDIAGNTRGFLGSPLDE